MDDFKTLLHALPQELYDEIFHLTFTRSEISRTIDETYKPPSSLQVSRSTRQQFAKSYYGEGSIFYLSRFRLQAFVNSLPPRHRLFFFELHVFDAEIRLRSSRTIEACEEDWVVLNSVLDASGSLYNAVKFKTVYPDGTGRWVDIWYSMEKELDL